MSGQVNRRVAVMGPLSAPLSTSISAMNSRVRSNAHTRTHASVFGRCSAPCIATAPLNLSRIAQSVAQLTKMRHYIYIDMSPGKPVRPFPKINSYFRNFCNFSESSGLLDFPAFIEMFSEYRGFTQFSNI